MNQQSLKSKTTHGMLWSAVGKISQYGITFLIGIVIARILMPSDYGLIGMLSIFFAVSILLVEGGFSNALIQKQDRTDIDFSTIFFTNLFVSVLLYLILFFTAPLIAEFYQIPQLIVLTRVLSLTILINSLNLVQQTRLIINMDFKTQAIISFISVIVSGTFGILAAYQGFGVWALVIQSISDAIVRSILLFYFNRWMPQLIFSITSFKKLFKFSSNLLAAGLVATIVNNLYNILIGKYFYAKDLGYYANAKQYPEFMAGFISSVVQGVSFPVLASLQNEKDRMKAAYGRIMGMIVFLIIPLLTLFALLSGPFVHFLLTDKWMPVVPLIQWLCFARMITPISTLNMNILNAIGKSNLFFRVDISKFPITIAALIITVPLGLKAVVIGHFTTSFISFFINAYYPGKLFGFGAFRQIKEMRFVVIATLIMAICVYFVLSIISGDLAKLSTGILVGICSFLLSAYLLKIRELKDVKEMILSIINK